jgi:hypothetical protein
MSNQDDPHAGSGRGVVGRYLDWLDSEIKIRESYHNHKETMAWSATGAYTGLIILAYYGAPYLDSRPKLLGFSLVVVLTGWATSLFVNMQFKQRWKAADMIRGLRRARGRLSPISEADFLTGFNYNVPAVPSDPWEERPHWPWFIEDEITACKTNRRSRLYELRFLLCFSTWEKVNARSRSEWGSYIILAVVTVVAFATTWLVTREPSKEIISAQTILRDSKKELDEVAHKLRETESNLKPAIADLAQTESKFKAAIDQLSQTEFKLKATSDELTKTKANYKVLYKALKEVQQRVQNVPQTP